LDWQALISPLPVRKFASLGEEVGLAVDEWQRTGDPAMIEQKMLIGGEACNAGNAATVERKNPLDGTVASRAPAATVADAVRACEAAAAAFPAWAQLGPGARRALLIKASDTLHAKGDAIAAAMASETGASGHWAGFNVHLASNMLLEAASLTTQISGEVIPPMCPAAWPWRCASPPGWCSVSRRGMRR